jgi:hypothetical protein
MNDDFLPPFAYFRLNRLGSNRNRGDQKGRKRQQGKEECTHPITLTGLFAMSSGDFIALCSRAQSGRLINKVARAKATKWETPFGAAR